MTTRQNAPHLHRGLDNLLQADTDRQRYDREPETADEWEAHRIICALTRWSNAGNTNRSTWGAVVPRA